MDNLVRIHLQPLGKTLSVARGTPLKDVLFDYGVEFPCGGEGYCLGCRVRVIEGSLPLTPEHEAVMERKELEAGWRLACCSSAESDVTLAVAQWRDEILTDDSSFDFRPQTGLGIAVDLGTTTLAAQLLDLRTAEVMAVETALNPQAVHGSDIMRRIEFGLTNAGRRTLCEMIRRKIGELIDLLFRRSDADRSELNRIAIVGNTVMHHLFCDRELAPLAYYPFESPALDGQRYRGSELRWNLPDHVQIDFLPSMGSFVGSDVLAGILATGMDQDDHLNALLDLGTNGEIVVGSRQRLLYASTAAGPAFEGARISMGIRATTGAISAVKARNGRLECHVIGDVEPRGICGSGLVDAVAGGLDLKWILPHGRVVDETREVPLAGPVRLLQQDIRELQLAKGAMAAGLQLLLRQWGATVKELKTIYLAGAFGNYINRDSALRIGLLPAEAKSIQPVGNTALHGAKMALFVEDGRDERVKAIRATARHVSLAADPDFQDAFVEAMHLSRN